METTNLILTIAVGVYEVLSRAIPTYKRWSIIGNILSVLTFASNLLDNKKPKS